MATNNQGVQIFVQSPQLRTPTSALTLNPDYTIHQLKLSLFPSNLPSHTLNSLYFTFQGKTLKDSSSVLSCNLPQFSYLTLQIRVPGGGGDGGATGAESRDCYLNMYAVKKPDKVDPNEKRLSKWTTCALSFEPLKHPCVVDKLGNVFNKEVLVNALLGKKLPKEFGHIRGLKDMIPIQLSLIPGVEAEDELSFKPRFQCPITGLEFNGKYKFFTLKNCGHVLSAKALKEVKSSACLVCHVGFLELDKIVINGSEEEVATLRERMEEEKAKLKEMKVKKAKNVDVRVNGDENVSVNSSRLSGSKRDNNDKVFVEVEENGKIVNRGIVTKPASNSAVKRFKAADMTPANATKEVYASIFTSSKKSDIKETFSCRSLPLGRN